MGLSAESRTPKPSALTGVKPSIACIHFGIAASSPGFGRPFHCFTPSAMAPRPSSRTTMSPSDGPLASSVAPVASRRRKTSSVTSVMPATQPTRNAGPLTRALTENSIRMQAMIGMGLIAIPIASGSRLPSEPANMGVLLQSSSGAFPEPGGANTRPAPMGSNDPAPMRPGSRASFGMSRAFRSRIRHRTRTQAGKPGRGPA